MKSIARKIALSLPPLRRLYDFAMLHAQGHAESQQKLIDARQQLTEVQSQLASSTTTQETLELQLYVMRSDLQRAAVRNEALSVVLGELESKVSQGRQIAELCDVVRETAAATSAEVSLAFAKLAGKMTIMASEKSRMEGNASQVDASQSARYLDLLELTLTGMLWNDEPIDPWSKRFDPEVRAIGRDWPKSALTMIGSARLRNFRILIENVLHESVPGDILEAGVWRGGACVLARGVLAAHNDPDRKIWVADSFKGLPPPDDRYPADAGDEHSLYDALQVSSQQVRDNFRQYGLLDDRVHFLEGWFEDTLPIAPIEKLAVLRLDGDMYSSTMQTLDALYAKVSIGGYVIVDDYILKGCQMAIHDFRERESIIDPMQDIDGAAIYWKKTRA